MTPQRLLLLSNSTMAGKPYLEWARPHLGVFLRREVRRVFFVPFAGVTVSWDDYTEKVSKPFADLGYELVGAHTSTDPAGLLGDCDAVAVGGGNTFHLLAGLYDTGLLEPIRSAVSGGKPYVGWSAGSNVACPTIRTTNDMPIVEPPSLAALGLVPFQISAHYTEARLPGHAGESRAERLAEFVAANPGVAVVGLAEGSALQVEDEELKLIGREQAVVFGLDAEPRPVNAAELAGLGLLSAR